jgi:hypothetical protein
LTPDNTTTASWVMGPSLPFKWFAVQRLFPRFDMRSTAPAGLVVFGVPGLAGRLNRDIAALPPAIKVMLINNVHLGGEDK